ncbi:MAG: F0F1 ATP synthase subunit B [Gemmatimonadota bacterium]
MSRSRAARTVGMAVAALAVAPALLAAQEGAEGGSPIFSVNLGLVIWTWILFLFTLGILAWKVFPFIAGGLEERQRRIQGAIDEAQAAREEAHALLAQQREALEAARREGHEVVEKARAAAEGVRKEILAEAKQQQLGLLADARREIEAERQQLREDVRREAVEIALAAAERLIRTRLDADENRRLVRDFMAELE